MEGIEETTELGPAERPFVPSKSKRVDSAGLKLDAILPPPDGHQVERRASHMRRNYGDDGCGGRLVAQLLDCAEAGQPNTVPRGA